jgi:hypothetical protein
MNEYVPDVIFDGGEQYSDILEQFLVSGYYKDNQLNIDRFLDEDRTIDLEKLELAIILLMEYLENSIEEKNPIYINIGNMYEYVAMRNLIDVDKIIEESTFILGFCQAIATENEINNKIIVRFKGKNNV